MGRPAEDLVGTALSDLVRPADPADSMASLLRAASAAAGDAPGAAWRRLSVVTVRPDGAPRLLAIQALARTSGGEVVGFQGTVRDETGGPDGHGESREFGERGAGPERAAGSSGP
jgi:hypothetical protein